MYEFTKNPIIYCPLYIKGTVFSIAKTVKPIEFLMILLCVHTFSQQLQQHNNRVLDDDVERNHRWRELEVVNAKYV